MKSKKILMEVLIFLIMILLCLTGCSKIEKLDPETGTKEGASESKEDLKVAIRLNSAEEFNEEYGYAVISETINFETTKYVIDKEFNVIHSFKQGSYATNTDYIDGYRIEQNEDKSFCVVDIYGKEVFTYGEHEYSETKLLTDGCIYLKKQTDTYNSTEIVAGIYDLSQSKYVVEPNAKYTNIYENGEKMYKIEEAGNSVSLFNTKTKKITTFNIGIVNNFKDGYSIDDRYNSADDSYYIDVLDENGGTKSIKLPNDTGTLKNHQNGMYFCASMHPESGAGDIKDNTQLINLETGVLTDFGNREFYLMRNEVKFTTSGHGLVYFNNQGGMPYYTIIDKNGNKMFEPVKVNDNAAYGDDNGEKRMLKFEELFEGDYIIVQDDGIDTVVNVNNKVVVQAEEFENFEGITNNVIKVLKKEQGSNEQRYYKDLEGNIITIYK